jgi:hypothetical protein
MKKLMQSLWTSRTYDNIFTNKRGNCRGLSDELKATARNAQKTISMANFNQQYSQKCNIKITDWKEKTGGNRRQDFCEILREKVDVNPNAIHSWGKG